MARPAATLEILSPAGHAASATPLTVGLVFAPGEIAPGAGLTATGSDGRAWPLQADLKAHHADGSLRHAIVTIAVPPIASRSARSVRVDAGAPAAVTPSLGLAALLATEYEARVELTLGGETYSRSARESLSAGKPLVWLAGPLAAEWIVGGPVVSKSGTPHAHLAVYFHVRAYAGKDGAIGAVRTDVVVENGWLAVAGPANLAYDAVVSVGGRRTYAASLQHFHHSRWHRVFWWGEPPGVYARPDPEQLQASGAVPRYQKLSPSAKLLDSWPQEPEPMSTGSWTRYMPDSGAHIDIGPLPLWTTAFVVTGDERAYRAMLANDSDAGTFSVHYRDERTGRPVSIADHPLLTNEFGLLPEPSGANPNVADAAHQPSIAFVSYLQTGDYFYLEELQFWTSWNQLSANPLPPFGYREGSKGIFGVQVRGQAWSLRNLAQAAYATPDEHPYKAQLVASVGHNLAHAQARYADNAAANHLGALESYDGYRLFAPWMDDFYTWTMGYLVDLGFPAQSMRAWKARFAVGRMGVADYCYLHGSTYRLVVGTSNSDWWPDFATLYRENFGEAKACPPGGAVDGYPDPPSGYGANLRPALAVAVDAGVDGAVDAWRRLLAARPQPDFNDYPNWAVIPRRPLP